LLHPRPAAPSPLRQIQPSHLCALAQKFHLFIPPATAHAPPAPIRQPRVSRKRRTLAAEEHPLAPLCLPSTAKNSPTCAPWLIFFTISPPPQRGTRAQPPPRCPGGLHVAARHLAEAASAPTPAPSHTPTPVPPKQRPLCALAQEFRLLTPALRTFSASSEHAPLFPAARRSCAAQTCAQRHALKKSRAPAPGCAAATAHNGLQFGLLCWCGTCCPRRNNGGWGLASRHNS
jgi:hypothetical protein